MISLQDKIFVRFLRKKRKSKLSVLTKRSRTFIISYPFEHYFFTKTEILNFFLQMFL